MIFKFRKEQVPKVEFATSNLQIRVGHWLNVSKGKTPYELGKLLKTMGISESETCVFESYNPDRCSYSCHLEKTNEDIKIKLYWGGLSHPGQEFVIDTKDYIRRYEYFEKQKHRPAELKLLGYTLKNRTNGNSLERAFSFRKCIFMLTNGSYELKIEIGNPRLHDNIGHNKEIYKLSQEYELEQYLLSLKFPIDIFEVYRKIREYDNALIADYPNFDTEIVRVKDDDEEKIVTDKILFENGQLINLIKTRDLKTIKIDSNGDWFYKAPFITVGVKEGLIDYNLESQSEKELKETVPINQFNQIKEEVEQIRVLARTLEQSNN